MDLFYQNGQHEYYSSLAIIGRVDWAWIFRWQDHGCWHQCLWTFWFKIVCAREKYSRSNHCCTIHSANSVRHFLTETRLVGWFGAYFWAVALHHYNLGHSEIWSGWWVNYFLCRYWLDLSRQLFTFYRSRFFGGSHFTHGDLLGCLPGDYVFQFLIHRAWTQ